MYVLTFGAAVTLEVLKRMTLVTEFLPLKPLELAEEAFVFRML